MKNKTIGWRGSLLAIMALIIAILFALAANYYKRLSFLSSESAPTQLQQVKAQKVLRVGMLRTLTSFYINYRNANKINGFEQALLEDFANSLNVKVSFNLSNTVDELYQKLQRKEIDLIAADILGMKTLQDKLNSSLPYYFTAQQVVYRKGSKKPYSLKDIHGNLMVVNDSSQDHLLKDLKSQYPKLRWQTTSDLNQEEILKLVDERKINYTVADSMTIALMQRIYPMLTPAFTIIKKQPLSWHVLKNDDVSLLEQANLFIEEATEAGSIQQLVNQYLSYMNSFDYVDTRAFIRAIDKKLPLYQPLFEKYAQKNGFDWRLIAAMAYQESHWNPEAISSTGVRGMMMLTRSTAESLGITNRLDPEQSIRGGTTYLKKLMTRIPDSVPEDERVWFALAAYNMGFAHLLDARRLAQQLDKDPDSWGDIKQILPLLSDEKYYKNLKYGAARGHQAVHFIQSIHQYYISLIGYLAEKQYRQQEFKTKLEKLNFLPAAS